MKISNIKLIYRIFSCFLLFGIVVGGVVWFATAMMSEIDTLYSKLLDNDSVATVEIARGNRQAVVFRLATWRIIAETEDAAMKKAAEDKTASEKKFFEWIDGAKKHAPSQFKSRIEAERLNFEKLLPDYQTAEKLGLANKNLEARDLANKLEPQVEAIIERLSTLTDEMTKEVSTKSDEATATVNHTIKVTYASIGVAMAVVLALAFLLVQTTIVKPIGGLIAELKKLAEGDFNITLPWLGHKDEVGQIATAVGEMAEKVSTTISQIKTSGREVTNASVEISTSTSDLSQRTEEQAASLEETSASMEEMAATVKKNAENAKEASDLASSTRFVADRGGAVVAQTVEAMAKIEESSRKISDIIGVVDEIARQTNLLALNAAVEAARAGEAGRGFAVVASEVRSLAQRSSQAAKDIKDLITNSNGQVKDGVELVNKAGQSLSEIVASINKVTAVVSEIANASVEQSTGIEQINKALSQMDEVTQQNSALVEENAASAKTLESQAKSMDERIAGFRLRGGQASGGFDTSAAFVETATPMATARPKVTPLKRPAASAKASASAARGPVGRLQAGLATALYTDAHWKEF